MFDVLVIQTQKNSAYWESTLKSLENHPITVHKVWGEGKSQLENFFVWPDICTSEFISFVDDDDLVLDGAFERCHTHLQQNPHIKALYTNSICEDYVKNVRKTMYKEGHVWSVDGHSKGLPPPVHQLIIVERKLVQYTINRLNHLSDEIKEMLPHAGNNRILWDIIATQVPWYFFPEVCYIWRRHQASISYTRSTQLTTALMYFRKVGRQIFRNERIY